MSSSKGTSNSNKTAHVMNLLRKSNPPAQSQAVKPEEPSAPAAPAAPAPQVPPILTSLNADAQVSSQIRDALADALEAETSAQEGSASASIPGSEPEPIREAPHPAAEAPIPQVAVFEAEEAAPPAASPAAEEPAHQPAAASVPQPEASAPQAAVQEVTPAQAQPPVPQEVITPASDEVPVQAAPAVQPTPKVPAVEEAISINVMERLTDEKADKYIKLFGLCDCPRCRKDVVALALNHLEPKYVVMTPSDYRIRSDMYATRYASEITAQLLWACKAVMDNPRH